MVCQVVSHIGKLSATMGGVKRLKRAAQGARHSLNSSRPRHGQLDPIFRLPAMHDEQSSCPATTVVDTKPLPETTCMTPVPVVSYNCCYSRQRRLNTCLDQTQINHIKGITSVILYRAHVVSETGINNECSQMLILILTSAASGADKAMHVIQVHQCPDG